MKCVHNCWDRLLLVAVAALIPTGVFAQPTQQDTIWQPLSVFLGSWHGTGGGTPGSGQYERTYQFILNNRYIEVKNKSAYPPTEKTPNGQVHEDIGYFSYDKGRRTFVLRQFHLEGFVNQYKLDTISSDGKKFIFVSEAIENIPVGWRARETYEVLSDNQFQETFELAQPNKEFQVYSRVTFNRIK